jgi:hypothetical protein
MAGAVALDRAGESTLLEALQAPAGAFAQRASIFSTTSQRAPVSRHGRTRARGSAIAVPRRDASRAAEDENLGVVGMNHGDCECRSEVAAPFEHGGRDGVASVGVAEERPIRMWPPITPAWW